MSAGGVGLLAADTADAVEAAAVDASTSVDFGLESAVDDAVAVAVAGAGEAGVEGTGADDSREHAASASNAKENAAPRRDAAR
jgi:hypothetical protein